MWDSVDFEPVPSSVLYLPVTRPKRLFSAGTSTTTRPSPSVLSMVIIVMKALFLLCTFTNTTETDTFFGVDEESPDSQYVDLLLNPERFTGYKGPEAWQIWDSIYEENCFK